MYIPVAQRKTESITTGYVPVAQRTKPDLASLDMGIISPMAETSFSTPSSIPMGTVEMAGGFLKEVGQSTARSIAAAGVTVAKSIAPKELKPHIEALNPDDMKSFFGQALVETVFGKEPDKQFISTKPIEDQVAEAELKIADWQKGIGSLSQVPNLSPTEKFVVNTLSNISPKLLAFPAIMGQIGLDLTPFGGLEKGAYRAMIKAKTLGEGMTVLKSMGVADDLAEKFAVDVVKVATEKDAAKLFNSIAKLQQTTKVATKTPQAIKDIYVPVEKRLQPLAQEAKKYGAKIEGNTITLYHGTDDISFNPSRLRNGSYLTTSEDIAKTYGKKVYEIKVSLDKISQAGTGGNEFIYKGIAKPYPPEIIKAYNLSNATKLSGKEINNIPLSEIERIAPMGLKGGKQEYNNLMTDFYTQATKGAEVKPDKFLTQVQKDITKKISAKAPLIKQATRFEKKIEGINTAKDILDNRRGFIRAAQQQFGLSDAELKSITNRDIRFMNNLEFKKYIDDVRIKADQLATKRQAISELQTTIQTKELQKWENVQKAMKLPTIEKMNIEQIGKLDEVLSQYKTADEFLPVRQLETINETELKGIRTVREVKEHLAKKYNLTPEQLPPIKPHPWMYDAQLARQNPLYDLLVDKYNYSYLKANGRILEMERKSDELIKAARKSNPEGIGGKVAPTDKNVVKWLEGDEAIKAGLAKTMTAEELKAAQYQDSIYKEYYDWLSKRELDKKFSSRFEDKYFPHTRRGFLEAWKEDGFLRAVKETKDSFIQEERLLTILDEKTKEILPYQKWVGFAQFRTGGLVPTQNASRAFKTYITALEKARQFDEFIPEIMIYVHSLTPRNLTARGVEMDDSIKRFIKSWINSKKGRTEKQIIKPGSKIDWALRTGVALTRIRDLGLNIPVGIANIFGEQAGNLTMLGAKNYSLGVGRLATKRGREITKKYANFVGKTFWEKLTEASNTAGDQLLGGIYGLFGASSRKGNQVFLLGSMTSEEFAKGAISLERLAQLRKGMGRYRNVEGAESIFGKSVEGAVGGQYKKWAIPILTSTASNARILSKKLLAEGLPALKSKEGAELFYSVVLGSAVGLGTYGYYEELSNKKDRSFVEDIIFKSTRDAMSLIGALDPKFIGSFAAPRLASFIVDLTTAIDDILFLEKTKEGKLKGVGELQRTLTPTLINQIIPEEKTTTKKNVPNELLKKYNIDIPKIDVPSRADILKKYK